MRSLDSSAVMAALKGEPGGELATRHMPGSLLSAVIYAEVIALLVGEGATAEQARGVVADLPVAVVDLDQELAFRTGELERPTRANGLSLADRACLALAERHGIPALTADRAWAAAGARLGIEVELIR
jgi:ribonuclease VapC